MIRSKLAAIVCGLLAAAPAAAQEVCGPLTARPSFTDTTIVSANSVTAANGVPAFCEVQATISPVAGLEDRRGVSPAGRVERQGARNRRRRVCRQPTRRSGGRRPDARLRRASRTTWATRARARSTRRSRSMRTASRNVEGIIDFGHRATHVATVVGKEVAARLYGRAPERAYWQGCSTAAAKGSRKCSAIPTTTTA